MEPWSRSAGVWRSTTEFDQQPAEWPPSSTTDFNCKRRCWAGTRPGVVESAWRAGATNNLAYMRPAASDCDRLSKNRPPFAPHPHAQTSRTGDQDEG